MSKPSIQLPRGKWAILSYSGGAIVVLLVLMTIFSPSAKTNLPGGGETFIVPQSALTISVTQSGTIRASEQEILKCEVEGSATLIFLIEEGTLVKEGDLLVELDSSNLEDALVDQEITLQNREASYIGARENLAVVKNQTESDLSLAELTYTFAMEDLKQYREKQLPKDINDADAKIALTKSSLASADSKLEWSERLATEEYISRLELESDQNNQQKAELDYKSALAEKDLLETATSKRQLAQLSSDVDQARMAQERTKLKASADIVQAEANLAAAEAEFNRQQEKREKLVQQIEKTKIYAPREGLVVYATTAESNRRGNQEPLDEGQTVRERQDLIHLPTAETMVADILVHESNLEKLRLGLPVVLKVDALPGKTYTGQILRIAPLPDAQSRWMSPDLKVYPAVIEIDGRNAELRTGMSCQAEIIVDQIEDAMYVPVQAVIKSGNQSVVFVEQKNEFIKTPVDVGLDNNRMIHIKSGIAANDVVLLTPPLEEGMVAEAGIGRSGDVDMDQLNSRLKDARENDQGAVIRNDNGVGRPGRGDTEGARQASPDGAGPAGREAAAAGGPGGGGMGEASSEQRQQMRARFENMTPEQRAEMDKMRERMQSMTPEERRAEMQKLMGGAGGQRGAGGPRGEGGQRGGRPAGGQP